MKRKDGRDTETRDRNKEERDTPIQEGFLEKRKKAYIQSDVSPSFFLFFFFFLVFLGPHPWHVEVPRLGVKSGR